MKDRDDNLIGQYFSDIWYFIDDVYLKYDRHGCKRIDRNTRMFYIDDEHRICVKYYPEKDCIYITEIFSSVRYKKNAKITKTEKRWIKIDKSGIYNCGFKYKNKMGCYNHTNKFLKGYIKGYMCDPELVFNKILKEINLSKRPGIEWSYEPKIYQELIKHKNPYAFIDKHNKDFQKKNKKEIYNIIKRLL